MAKRFTSTEKWKKKWYTDLPIKHKVLFTYLTDNCDHAGIWDTNWPLATFHIGAKVSALDLIRFGKRIVPLKDDKYFIVDFVEFQYGELSPECKPHRSVIKRLAEFGITPERIAELKGELPLFAGEAEGAKEKPRHVAIEDYPLPDDLEANMTRVAWRNFVTFRAREKKEPVGEIAAKLLVAKLARESKGDILYAVAMMHQSIERGWTGLFPVKDYVRNGAVSAPLKYYRCPDCEQTMSAAEEANHIGPACPAYKAPDERTIKDAKAAIDAASRAMKVKK